MLECSLYTLYVVRATPDVHIFVLGILYRKPTTIPILPASLFFPKVACPDTYSNVFVVK
jgi:hypothetical protein